jgi:hypothetical protein
MKEIQLGFKGRYTKKTGLVALVDDEDFEKLSRLTWSVSNCNGYLYASTETVRMHRLIMGAHGRHVLVDHKDGNTLNNQKANLRISNKSQNSANRIARPGTSSKYLGVSWSVRDEVWRAQLTKDQKHVYIGQFKRETDAAKAYNKAALKYHGEFARLNIIT